MERAQHRRHPSPHDGRETRRHLPALLRHRCCCEARPGRACRARTARQATGRPSPGEATMRRTLLAPGIALLLAALQSFSDTGPLAQQAAAFSAPQPPAAGRGGPPVQGAEPDIALVVRFDRNGDKRLDYEERTAARGYLAARPELRRPVRGGRINRSGTPGAKLSPRDVDAYPPSVPLYAPDALRTLFLEFEHEDWEKELEAFWHTDVEVPAK